MKKTLISIGIVVAVLFVAGSIYEANVRQSTKCASDQIWPCGMAATGNSNAYVYTPYQAGSVITSPVEVGGAIRASLIPTEGVRATVVNWDGLIIGETMLVKSGNSETGFVHYHGTVSFTPTECGKDQDFCHKGAIIFGKQYELPVRFK
ncbi:MAG TPA: hypothetical protein VF438_03540 [Candidatus Paceibacterota bacterium]